MISPMNFAARVTERTLALNTRLCLGLDPRPEAYPDASALRAHTLELLQTCADLAACVKPQLAFFELLGAAGLDLLAEVCALSRALGLPIILDGKRGDIGSTAAAYARAWLTGQHAGGALTVNPYLGFDTLTPFVEVARAEGGAVFVLVRTSNPGSGELQSGGLADRVAAEVSRLNAGEDGEGLGSVGAVVGATHRGELDHFRALMPRTLLLLPGLGAQGGRAADLAPAFLPGGIGALASASRAVQYAQGLDLGASRRAAQALRGELNAALES